MQAVPAPSWPDLVDAAAAALAKEAALRQEEAAVRDLDALLERGLVDVLADGLAARGIVVERERRYPIHAERKKRSEGLRCDLVLSAPGAPARDTVWLEVKRVAQHVELAAVTGFASRLAHVATADIAKLAADRGVPRGALLVVIHAEDETTGDAVVRALAHRCLDEGLPIELPYLRHVALLDRMGNAVSTIALIPVRRL